MRQMNPARHINDLKSGTYVLLGSGKLFMLNNEQKCLTG